ncbi:MAG: hypothetical protein LBI14_10455 [Treponema sp.]|jgi:hypothetical protein|nr:hypothetical protein [Treponema sp.]
MDDEKNALLEAKILKAVKAEGEPLKFSLEEIKASEAWCYKSYGKIGRMEKIIRRERALAAAKPDLYLN